MGRKALAHTAASLYIKARGWFVLSSLVVVVGHHWSWWLLVVVVVRCGGRCRRSLVVVSILVRPNPENGRGRYVSFEK